MNTGSEAARYLQACKNPFWRQVFAAELEYLLRHLRPGDEVLSVGCGPAIIEGGLAEHGFSIVGLDVSQDAIACVPDAVRTIVAPAEKMPFEEGVFDVVLFIVTLQFVENYRQALAEARRVLRPGGRVIVMLLNPVSNFFNAKHREVDSYVSHIKHLDLSALEATIAEHFVIDSEYFLGISDDRVFVSTDPAVAALYVVRGQKMEETHVKT